MRNSTREVALDNPIKNLIIPTENFEIKLYYHRIFWHFVTKNALFFRISMLYYMSNQFMGC